MNIAVRYYSRGGNTKKLADAIGNELNVQALDLTNPVDELVDILFLGSSMYAFTVDKNVKDFIAKLDPNKIKLVVNFSSSASDTSTAKKVGKFLKKRGIKILEEHYSCPGQFLKMNKGRPNEEDLKNIAVFARDIVSKYSK